MTKAEKDHLDAVAALGCLVCGAPANIHHLRRNPETGQHLGMGQRASHFHVIPLCQFHHQTGGFGIAFHAGPREWERLHGTETELWTLTQNLLRRNAA